MVVSIEELKEEQLDVHLARILERDLGIERKETWETFQILKDIRKEIALIERARRELALAGPVIEARKKKILNQLVRFLVQRKKQLEAELADIKEEYRELGIEEREEARLLRGV
ncbi:MAG: hypothetical protein ACP5IJ_00425 [Candidatus Nanoarchaeia archaeon]